MKSSKPKIVYGTGRRKTASARVMLSVGSGKRTVRSGNSSSSSELREYFTSEEACKKILKPLTVLGQETTFDIDVVVRGGGVTGQIGAAQLGVARALVDYDESMHQTEASSQSAQDKIQIETDLNKEAPLSWRRLLRKENLLTRDAREVERKKVGLRKARKRKQFSKR